MNEKIAVGSFFKDLKDFSFDRYKVIKIENETIFMMNLHDNKIIKENKNNFSTKNYERVFPNNDLFLINNEIK